MESFLTAPQFAKQIGVSKNTVMNWERKGLIVPHHVSPTGRRYYSTVQVSEFLSGKFKACSDTVSEGAEESPSERTDSKEGGVDLKAAPDG